MSLRISGMVRVAKPQVGKDEIRAVTRVLESGNYVSGRQVEIFEELFADYLGMDHAVAVNSGTAALHAAIAATGLGPGDEVIVPGLTFFSTVSAVIHAGAKPVFCDIDPKYYCMDPNDLEKRMSAKTAAIIPVHLFGHPADMHEIVQIAGNVPVIEDCAQAHGAEYDAGKVGGWGAAGCYSFFATKNMTTGEGGMVVTDDESCANWIRKFRSHGMSDRHTHEFIGYNYRMTEIAAAMGIVQLRKLDKMNEVRQKWAERYLKALWDLPWLILPQTRKGDVNAWFTYPVYALEGMIGMSTDEILGYLRGRGVEVRRRYKRPLYRQPALGSEYAGVMLPNTEAMVGRLFGLPNRPDMTKREFDRVVEALHGIS